MTEAFVDEEEAGLRACASAAEERRDACEADVASLVERLRAAVRVGGLRRAAETELLGLLQTLADAHVALGEARSDCRALELEALEARCGTLEHEAAARAEAAALREKVVAAVVEDRALLEKGTTAFTSHVRAYLEHRLPFIFRWQKVDVGSVARLYALLKLPEMPELRKLAKQGKKIDFDRVDVKTGTIKFKDAHREAARQKRWEAEHRAGKG